MTVRPAQLIPSGSRLRTAFALAVAVGTSTLLTADVEAQTSAASGSAPNSGNAGQVGNSNSDSVFAETATTDGFETAGESQGRFLGSQLSTQPTAGGNTNTTQNAASQFRNLQRINQQFNRNNQNQFGAGTQGTRTIRPSLRLGFKPKPRPPEALRSSVGKHLLALTTRLPRLAEERSDFSAVKFDLGKSGEVVLTGEVPTDDARRLLALILRMEPGVSSVRNDLKIAPPAPEPAPQQ